MHEHTRQDMGDSDNGEFTGMGIFDFIDCPLCAGHEKIGADAADALAHIIEHAFKYYVLNLSPAPHIITELENIKNAIRNAKEFGRSRLAAEPAGLPERSSHSVGDPLFD